MGKAYKLNQVKVIHNGMDIQYYESENVALSSIHSYIDEQSRKVSLSLCSDSVIPCSDSVDSCDSVRVIIYQYYTHYMEVFVLKKV